MPCSPWTCTATAGIRAIPKVAQEWAGQVRGTPRLRQRIQAGLTALARDPRVDAGRIAAVGYCFGGTAVLELAYSGAGIKGVVTFHAGLTLPGAEDLGRIKDEVPCPARRRRSLRQPGPDRPSSRMPCARPGWTGKWYSTATPSTASPTPPPATDKSKGAAYDPLAAKRSWEHMKLFLGEIL